MSVFLEALGAVIQAVVEAAAEVFGWSREEPLKHDDAPDA
ncbi:glycerol-3-phosphate dehydrogenase/oxidase [Pseudarthrobacter enclensis]|nr:glycerol-3-phosphate dehydrogenase/oxidase [Pseudarthrobacter enclensis]